MVSPLSKIALLPETSSWDSRYFRVNDPHFLTYHYGSKIPVPHRFVWNFRALGLWSRIYEYPWLLTVARTVLTCGGGKKTAIDAGCGDSSPGCFMLAELGFDRVIALDVLEDHRLLRSIGLPNLEYHHADISEPLGFQADLVCCVSVLEHIHPERQARALENLCAAVAPGGLLLLTFDVPGFEWDTDLDLYRHTLAQQSFDHVDVEVPAHLQLSSRNGPIPRTGWLDVGRPELRCFRLLAWPRPTEPGT